MIRNFLTGALALILGGCVCLPPDILPIIPIPLENADQGERTEPPGTEPPGTEPPGTEPPAGRNNRGHGNGNENSDPADNGRENTDADNPGRGGGRGKK